MEEPSVSPRPSETAGDPDPADEREALEAAVEAPGGAEAQAEAITAIADETPDAVLAEAIADLEGEEMRAVFAALGTERSADVVSELDPDEAVDVLQQLPQSDAADVLEEMDPDDAADVVGELRDEDAPAAERLLAEMEAEEAADVRQLLAYPDDSAGGIMTTDFLSVPAAASVQEAVALLRASSEDEVPPESASYLYVTDEEERLEGVVRWHRLERAGEKVAVRALMEPQTITVPVSADQETVALEVREHHLFSVPVVDVGGRLVGIVTADDVADVLEEEVTKDIERLGGSEPLEMAYLRAGPLTLARKRAGWLLLLFLGSTYTGRSEEHTSELQSPCNLVCRLLLE